MEEEMTYAFLLGLIAAVLGLPYLWRQHRLDFWAWLAWYAGRRLGALDEKERQRRYAGEHLILEVRHKWDGLA